MKCENAPKVVIPVLIAIIILLCTGLVYTLWFKDKTSQGYIPQPGEVACTMEAKLCPDGSYVGRTGPKCEFTPCPTTSAIE